VQHKSAERRHNELKGEQEESEEKDAQSDC